MSFSGFTSTTPISMSGVLVGISLQYYYSKYHPVANITACETFIATPLQSLLYVILALEKYGRGP